ncbi:hypothetical protein PVAG01_07858 [Phlyctema vagabunda]|uniref:Zn(2)-C6 fungal-type domain-containing protein n=1 Tax=Phlyctema vagabunda TaxID=108571 RepID=A0ABR4PDL9_9HELO
MESTSPDTFPTGLIDAASDSLQDQDGLSASEPPPIPDVNGRATVPSACVACRSKHLKCDGQNPCSRCNTNDLECIFVKSRRGYKGPRKRDRTAASLTHSEPLACPAIRNGQSPSVNGSNFSTDLPDAPLRREQSLSQVTDDTFSLNGHDLANLGAIQFNPQYPPLDFKSRCFEAYFSQFNDSHPFLLPRNQLLKLLKQKPMEHLEAAIRYIGSFYVKHAPTEDLFLEAEKAIYRVDCPKDGFRVQALLLLAIGLDGYTTRDKALEILNEAEDLAMELGMHRRDYSLINGAEQRVLEESWRRTWWELFIVDGMIAAVHQESAFRLFNIVGDVPLPCEESDYASGYIPSSQTLSEFDDETFLSENISFSSFTYRIAAIRNTGRVLQLGNLTFADGPTIDRVDAHLVNWKLHLPESKKIFIAQNQKVDEMLFQAHMVTEATTILLHRDHSELDFSAAQNITSCAPYHGVIPGQQYNTHAAKMIQAAQNISKLITLPVDITKHTMFFTCVVTLASIVHLSVWSVMMPMIQDGDIKQQLRLTIGTMKALWQVWPSAGLAFGQVKGVAQEIFAAKKTAAEIGTWTNFTHDEIMRNMIENERIMEVFTTEGQFGLQV